MQASDEQQVRPSPIHGRNQWPDSRPSFSSALKTYVEHMGRLGDAIMRGIALGLHLSPEFFEQQYRGEPYWVVRVIHYPPLPAQRKGPRARQMPQRAPWQVCGRRPSQRQLSCDRACGECAQLLRQL